MKPFRKHVALAVDGGGIRGVICTRALAMLEEQLGQTTQEIFRLIAGTSTGAIIAGGVASGLSGKELYNLYVTLGGGVFRKSWRTTFFPLARFRYSPEPFRAALQQYMGDRVMGDFWAADPPTDVIITSFDLFTNHTRFIKSWKEEYKNWPVIKAVMASSTVPTYFPVVEGRYVDGGVGSFANPCYLAAYEILNCLNWDPQETTLISLGTGRTAHVFDPGQSVKLWPWQWIGPTLGAFLQSADDQQGNLVTNYFCDLDFRRFQVDLKENIEMDHADAIPKLAVYGEEMGRKILNDETDPVQDVIAAVAPVAL
jgi:hypothetical protein